MTAGRRCGQMPSVTLSASRSLVMLAHPLICLAHDHHFLFHADSGGGKGFNGSFRRCFNGCSRHSEDGERENILIFENVKCKSSARLTVPYGNLL